MCSQVGDVAELVGREHIGLAVENDPLEFGTAILTLLKDNRLADDMGKRARRVAERQFDVAVQGSHIERVYRRLVSEQLASSVRQHKEQSVVSEHSST